MQLLDSVKCVVCGKIEYQRSKGRSSRSFAGVCKEHQQEVCSDAASDANESGPFQTSIPEGKPRKSA